MAEKKQDSQADSLKKKLDELIKRKNEENTVLKKLLDHLEQKENSQNNKNIKK